MKTILVLGVNGFTGRHFQDFILRRRLIETYSFVGADWHTEQRVDIDYRELDLLEGGLLEKLLADVRPDYVLNFAGIFGSNDSRAIYEANAELSRRLLETALSLGLATANILLIGSAAEYGSNQVLPLAEESHLCPVSHYGLSKVVQSQYALFYHRTFGMNVNVARTFNIIGKGMSPTLSIPSFAKQVAQASDGDHICVGNMNTRRDFLDISDVVNAYWNILLHGINGRIYNVCSGTSELMSDVLDYMISRSGKRLHVVVKEDHVRKHDVRDSRGDNSLLVRDTTWRRRVTVREAIDNLDVFGEALP